MSIFIKSHEKGLITKEYVVADTHFTFKRGLRFSTLALKIFNSGTK